MKRAPEKLAVVGLGYVGLPLAIAFANHRPVVGFDIDQSRITELKDGRDRTQEIPADELRSILANTSKGECGLTVTSDAHDLHACRIFLVTVPTPITADKIPDLNSLRAASESVGKLLKPGDLVVYEPTVYPGATEEVCIPILESASGLTHSRDFSVGYSPERINPGDAAHRVSDIVKIVAGSTPEATEKLAALYGEITEAGIHCAESIQVAEAAKVIENSQRDLNIALINECTVIFKRMGIDTESVLRAAETKWNFHSYRPGLVGGHCIGVDPYYLTHKAMEVGYHAKIILAGRQLNDSMADYAASQMADAMSRRQGADGGSDAGTDPEPARILVMGAALKENTPDLRNSHALILARRLKEHGFAVDIWDPCVNHTVVSNIDLPLINAPEKATYDGIVIAVAHEVFRALGAAVIRGFGKPGHVLFDLKYMLSLDESDLRL